MTVEGSGWRPDPTGRHEGRYYAGGQATDLVRDGGVESIDTAGKEQLAELAVGGGGFESPPPARPRGRMKWVAVSLLVVLVFAGIGLAATLYLTRDKESVDDTYLAAVREAGLTGEFNSNANAVAHGKQVCRKLEDGGLQQGMPVDEIAVAFYCPQFKEGFHVLETLSVAGSFTLIDDSPSYSVPSIEVVGGSCIGAGGYGDIHPGTQLTVKNGKNEVLTTAVFQPGAGGRYRCTFPFSFEVIEGEDRYILSVPDRGEFSYSFGDLKSIGVELSLGG